MPKNRCLIEVWSSGIDEALQGLTSNPQGTAPALATGLRVPAFSGGDRYLFLLASRKISKPTRIRGLRQLVTIGCNVATSILNGPPLRPIELQVTTPTWAFPDGNISWHLVRENGQRRVYSRPLSDTSNFAFIESDTPALLYQTFTNDEADRNTGAPAYYMKSLSAYTAPQLWPDWREPLGGLGEFYDIRFPWSGDHAWDSVDIPVPVDSGEARISLYASVLQTADGGAPLPTSITGTTTYLGPEDGFVASMLHDSFTPLYWRVGGAIIFEDEE